MLHPNSEVKFVNVHPKLIEVVRRAAEKCPLHVLVTCGVRTRDQQAQLVKMGASKTMLSYHLPQLDGYSHAVDTAFWLDADGDGSMDNGEVHFDWPLYDQLARAMRDAAREFKVRLIWGAVWDAELNTLTDNPAIERDLYAARERRKGNRPFQDGPHFQFMGVVQEA